VLPLVLALTVAPFSFDRAPGRLPKTVVPLDYRIAIVPDVGTKTFAGTESVTLTVRKTTDRIVFNTLNETLRDVRLDGTPVARVQTANEAQLTTLTLARAARVGRHVLTFAYTGRIESAPQGLFAQQYRTPSGSEGTMLSTQFEATDARRMFPSWDEPAFRATYQLTVTVPANWTAVSNMPAQSRIVHGTIATTTFRRTPKMPSYLVEFSAGDLGRISANVGGVEHRVWAPSGEEQDGRYALAASQQILADYNAYFGVPYPLPKLDHIAIPGGFGGAMENWGAITYTSNLLLLPPLGALEQRQETFSVMAHEMAHQWNGDLVTMGWWDDIWLNESFASWMAAKETALRNPTWQWWEGRDADKERAMAADAHTTSHPIEQHVANELQAEASFDEAITYDKGQSFLRMLESYLGEETFRDGIRRYVRAHAYSNATSADLWNALTAASGKEVAAMASSWTTQAGFPLVTVTASCDAAGRRTIALAQQRFLLDGTDASHERWSIPMEIRWGANAAPERVLLREDGQTLAAGSCREPLSSNAGDVGFYRVKYDDATFETNRMAFAALPDPEKIALLDDQWALALGGQAALSSYVSLASSMGGDLDARAWRQIAGALTRIERDARGTREYTRYLAYARSLLRPVYVALGWEAKADEAPPARALRRTVLAALGAWGDPEVVAEARARFQRFVSDRNAISADDRATILGIVGIHADPAQFAQLHAIARVATNVAERRRAYDALASVRDPQLAQQVLAIALSPELPPQARSLRLELVAQVAEQHPQLSWRFFQEHNDELLAGRSQFERILSVAEFVPSTYWDAAPLDELGAWVRGHLPAEAGPYIARGLARARFRLQEKQRLASNVCSSFPCTPSGRSLSSRAPRSPRASSATGATSRTSPSSSTPRPPTRSSAS
jgi:aminopeptidase N